MVRTDVDRGLINLSSSRSVDETLARIEAALLEAGLEIFCVVDHSDQAEQAGLHMRPTKVITFGSPEAGTPVMLAAPSIAIDLPLKALVWQDEDERVWVSYDSPDYLQERHSVPDELVKNVSAVGPLIQKALA
jgi:uncharacterized protein (DUF302 family)